MAYSWVDKAVYEDKEGFTLVSNAHNLVTIPTITSDSKALLFEVDFTDSLATSYDFKALGFCNITISYKNPELPKDDFWVNFNRDKDLKDGKYTNTAILELVGNDIESVVLDFFNEATEPLEIEAFRVFTSQDVGITQIANILKEETINADIVQATGAIFSSVITAQLVRTNIQSMLTTKAQPGQRVNYIDMRDWTQQFKTVVLGSETEQLKMEVEIAGNVETINIWYALIDGADAYKYYTSKDPRDVYPDISDSDRDKFKVLIYKPTSTQTKLSIQFNDTQTEQDIPCLIFGAGTGVGNNGKGFIYKNNTGFYHIYQKDDGSGNCGIVMDNNGVHIKGVADQYCEKVTFKDNGVVIKFAGQEAQRYEYIVNSGAITGYIQNGTNVTTVGYEAGNV